MIVETQNFLETHFTFVSKILKSSELSITSEGEVYYAAEKWLSYNFKERSKFAKHLLLTVRLPLLLDHTLRYLINNSSVFTEVDECKAILNKVVNNKDNYYQNKSSMYYASRYCNQDLFNVVLLGGSEEGNTTPNVDNMKQLNPTNFSCVNVLSPMTGNRRVFETVYLKGEIYVFGGYDNDNKLIRSIEKYTPHNNSWTKVAEMYDDRGYYCVCAFMDKIYIIGGWLGKLKPWIVYNNCFQFDTKSCQLKQVSQMEEGRSGAACVVFEGSIVCSGGVDSQYVSVNTVESCSVVADTWTQMPSMIEERHGHRLVVVKSKLFVIGGNTAEATSEVFDSNSNTFVAINSPCAIGYNKSLVFGSRILIFQTEKEGNSFVVSYDVHKNKWSDQSCEAIDNLLVYSCVKLPNY